MHFPTRSSFLRRHAATLTWLALLLLTGASVAVAGHAHHGGSRLGMALAVAGIAWVKGRLLIRHYLEARRAGAVFLRIVTGFCALAPLALVASALREFLRG